MRIIQHFPFGRYSIGREKVFVQNNTCDFCGQVKQEKKSKLKFLYRYFTIEDASFKRTYSMYCKDKLFCCIECARAYGAI